MFRCLALAAAFALGGFFAVADDKKDKETKTLEGVIVCTKCTMKETDKCGHALKVKDGDKEVVYYVNDKGAKEKYHKGICPPGSEAKAKVTGKVVEKDGKKHLEEPKVEILD